MKDKKKAQKQTLDEVFRYGICDFIGDGISVQDTDFVILYMNKRAKEMIGDHVGEYCYVAYEGRDDVCQDCPLKLSFKDGAVHTAERVNPTKNGNLIVEITSSVIKDSSGEIIAGVEVARDVTERRRADDALSESRERFQALFNQASDSIFLLAPLEDGLIIEDANDAVLHMHGYSREEIIGKPITFLDDPVTAGRAPERVGQLMAGKHLTFEGKHIRKDGSIFYVEVSARLIHIGDRPYILAIDRDITERRMLERELLDMMEELLKYYKMSGRMYKAEDIIEGIKELRARLLNE